MYYDTASAIRNFDERHGKYIRIDGWMYFASGGKREINPLGLMVSAEDLKPYERLKVARVYRHTVYTRAVSAFANRKHELLVEASYAKRNGGSPPDLDEAREELDDLARAVRIAKSKLDRLDREISETTEGRQQAAAERMNAERLVQSETTCAQFIDEIREINV